MALYYANKENELLACKYIDNYIKYSSDFSFVSNDTFSKIKTSTAFKKLEKLYLKKIDIWALLCLYIGFVGMFIAIVLNFRKKSDKIASFLISVLVFLYSIYSIEIALVITNYNLEYPNSLYFSAWSSMLYGPLFYFYFKRIIIGYEFRKYDILHGVPVIVCILFLLPIYSLPSQDKLQILITNEWSHATILFISKWVSLSIYGGMVLRLFNKEEKEVDKDLNGLGKWKRNIIFIWGGHIIFYGIYVILFINNLAEEILFYGLIVSIICFIVYIGYIAYVNPDALGRINSKVLFRGLKIKSLELSGDMEYSSFKKYKKSGLTQSYSLELKAKLLILLDEEKVFKQNNITLQKLSEMLGTNRHNTSQIINEHFNLNFFELMNTYRIREAKIILRSEGYKNINIIDVAYEVGFNNKVTFNKSFKKYNHITPSEYMKSLVVA
ncbi:helix-turn-helix transcriptional regulator [Aquimarina sp. TRL1]|nr:helix-turn-helix transcriptional regulator [Aquimarina sp. TRL1]